MNTNTRNIRGIRGIRSIRSGDKGIRRSAPRSAAGLLAVSACLAAAGALAGPQITTDYGDQMPWFSADVNAMGSTGTALYRGGISTVFNPAFLAQEVGYRLDAGFCLDQEHEDRFQPLFDSFESYVTDAAIASNRAHYFQTGFGLVGRLGQGGRPLAVGLSLTDRYPFAYTFDEELRNPSPYTGGDVERDAVIEKRRREVTGTLRDLSVGIGYQAHQRLAVGAAAHYAFGTRTEVNEVRDYVTATNSYAYEDEFDLRGVNFTLGLRGAVSERLEVGVAWESGLSADGDWTNSDYAASTGVDTMATVDGSFDYPQAFRAGLTFLPRTDPRTVFTMEMEYKPWSDLEDFRDPGDDNPGNLDDTMDVRIGLQHTFYNGMPLRFGFRHFGSYADREAAASVFSAGVGAPLGAGQVAVSLELSKLTSIQAHQFPYPAEYFGDNFVSDPMARVEDTRFRVGVGYTVGF